MRTPRWIALALLILAASSSAAGGADAEKLPLVHRWEPGKVYHYETTMDWEITRKQPNDVFAVSVTMLFDVAVTQEAGSERKLAAVKYLSTKAIMDSRGVVETYDSAHPEASSQKMQDAYSGAAVGKSITLVYDKEDHCVDMTFLPTDFGLPFAEALRAAFDTDLPKKALALGETFTLSRVRGSNPWGAIKAQLGGSLESIVQHEGRKHARIVMQGSTVMVGRNGADEVQPGTTQGEEILFDLERHVITRHTMKDTSNHPQSNELSKTKNVYTLKGVSELEAGKG